jgi:hypothetical protein
MRRLQGPSIWRSQNVQEPEMMAVDPEKIAEDPKSEVKPRDHKSPKICPVQVDI